MGRHAGWIALHAGIAGGASVILVPEISWKWENVCQRILERENEGKRFSLIVVAEGAELPEAGCVTKHASNGSGQALLGGVGHVVAQELKTRLKRETRTVVLGHLQRGGPPTNFDRVLATQFGAHAVRMILQGDFGRMVSYQPPSIESVDIVDAVNRISQVDPDCSAVVAARALGVSFGQYPPGESPPLRSLKRGGADAKSETSASVAHA